MIDTHSHNLRFEGELIIVSTTRVVRLGDIDSEVASDERLCGIVQNLLCDLDSHEEYYVVMAVCCIRVK